VFCCESLSQNISSDPVSSISSVLHQCSHSTGTLVLGLRPLRIHLEAANLDELMAAVFDAFGVLCVELQRSVDTRVFVTLMRGQWEIMSDDLYTFVENLQEGRDYQVNQSPSMSPSNGHDDQGAWKSRQNAKSVARILNDWFRGTLTRKVGHDLTDKDVDLPLHSAMTQKLLADNSSAVNMSYVVF